WRRCRPISFCRLFVRARPATPRPAWRATGSAAETSLSGVRPPSREPRFASTFRLSEPPARPEDPAQGLAGFLAELEGVAGRVKASVAGSLFLHITLHHFVPIDAVRLPYGPGSRSVRRARSPWLPSSCSSVSLLHCTLAATL